MQLYSFQQLSKWFGSGTNTMQLYSFKQLSKFFPVFENLHLYKCCFVREGRQWHLYRENCSHVHYGIRILHNMKSVKV